MKNNFEDFYFQENTDNKDITVYRGISGKEDIGEKVLVTSDSNSAKLHAKQHKSRIEKYSIPLNKLTPGPEAIAFYDNDNPPIEKAVEIEAWANKKDLKLISTLYYSDVLDKFVSVPKEDYNEPLKNPIGKNILINMKKIGVQNLLDLSDQLAKNKQMRFEKLYFNERAGISFRNLIVVDIQPLYEEGIKRKFMVSDFYAFMRKAKNVLYFYNGPETIGSEDSPDNIINWLDEKSEYMYSMEPEEPEFAESTIIKESDNFSWDNVEFYDKGYSFFRDWMDAGVSWNGMKLALRYMFMNRKYDSREISVDEWKKILSEKDFRAIGESIADEGLTIWTPDISIGDLKAKWNNSLLCGGGMNECLKEIQLLLSTFNIKYTLVDKFIY